MSALTYEIFVVALLSLSGVSLSYLLGIRHIFPLAMSGLAAITSLYTLIAFGAWGAGNNSYIDEISLVLSLIIIGLALWFGRKDLRNLAIATGLLSGLGAVSLVFKYIIPVGERHHSDSAGIISNALIVIQREADDLFRLAETPKRGVALSVMLATGPDGRIFSAFVPMVFLSTLLAIVWIGWKLSSRFASRSSYFAVISAVGVFSLSVPMFRASMFYINGHTLLALGVALMLAGVVNVRLDGIFNQPSAALVLIGALTTVTARIEGLIFAGVMLAALTHAVKPLHITERIRLGVVLVATGGVFTWWLVAVKSPLFDTFGVPAWLIAVLTLAGSIVIAIPHVDRLRRWVYPVVFALGIALLVREAWQSGNLLNPALSQIPNLVFGEGGWATAALMTLGSLLVLGWRSQTSEYRFLVGLSILLVSVVLFSKTLDGGFGRPGFGDSVNRMWLQVLPVITVTTLVGYSHLLHQARNLSWGRTGRLRKAA